MKRVVRDEKILSYLLRNPSKSKFFLAFGYTAEDWTCLRDDLLALAASHPSRFVKKSPVGTLHEIVGDVRAPNGRIIMLRTGWTILTEDQTTMYLVTAYPG